MAISVHSPRRLFKRCKSQQSCTLRVTVPVHLGNYLLNLLCGNCIELTEATELIFTARHRYKPETLLSPVEDNLGTVYSRYRGSAAQQNPQPSDETIAGSTTINSPSRQFVSSKVARVRRLDVATSTPEAQICGSTNVFVHEYEFDNRIQGSNESLQEFFTDLQSLLNKCQYEDCCKTATKISCKERVLLARLVACIRSNDLRKSLLCMKDLTLEKAFQHVQDQTTPQFRPLSFLLK